MVGAVAAGVAAALVVGGYAAGDTLRVRSTARTFLDGVRAEDCAQVGRVSVWSGAGECSASDLGFGTTVAGYRLVVDRVGGDDDQAAVGVRPPGQPRAYSLHLVRRGSRWIVDAVDVSG